MTEKVFVEFSITEGKRVEFEDWLQRATSEQWHALNCVEGYRADDSLDRRAALRAFVDQMELKLRRNEHKSNWRDKPIDALFKLMLLEVEEFKVAHEFFSVQESRPELVDIANFALIVWDRLGLLDQTTPAGMQEDE